MYGVTEACVYQSAAVLRPGDSPRLLGTALPHCRLLVLDPHALAEVTAGPGEIHLGGPALARGYLGAESLTRARFREHPKHGRLFATGDRAHVGPGGELAFCGRADDLVKLNGFRVELGEVDARLAAAPLVRAGRAFAAVEGSRLVAYLEAAEPEPAEGARARALARFCAAALPTYMVPSAFVAVDAVAVNANGKIDRAGTRAAAAAAAAAGGEARRREDDRPRGRIEAAVAAVWEELGLAVRGRSESFGALGGDSLDALKFLQKIRHRLGVDDGERTAEERDFGIVRGTFAPGPFLERQVLKDYAAYLRAAGVEDDGEPGGPAAVRDPDSSPPSPATRDFDVMCACAAAGRLLTLRTFLDAGLPPGLPGERRHTPLHAAAARNDAAMVRALLRAGAAVHAVTEKGVTPAHLACGCEHPAALELLLDAGTALAVRDTNKQTLLHHAVRAGFGPTVRFVLVRAPALLDARDRWERSAVHWAALNSRAAALAALVAAGARVNSPPKARRYGRGPSTRLVRQEPLDIALERAVEARGGPEEAERRSLVAALLRAGAVGLRTREARALVGVVE